MTLVVYVVVTALVATGLFFGIRYFVRAYIRYRDSRLIICPDNGEAAIVEVDAVHAALTSALGQPDIRLQNCWRWPIHQACGQECLVQLDVAPARVSGSRRFDEVVRVQILPLLWQTVWADSAAGSQASLAEPGRKTGGLARSACEGSAARAEGLQAGLLGLLHSAVFPTRTSRSGRLPALAERHSRRRRRLVCVTSSLTAGVARGANSYF